MNLIEAVKATEEGKIVKSGDLSLNISVANRVEFITKSGEIIPISSRHFFSIWEIYKEEDNWNLADNKYHFGLESPFAFGFNREHIKTFIQKIKEDIGKKVVETNTDYNSSDIFEIIDKRAGKL